MERTTIKTLHALVDNLNDVAGMPRECWAHVAVTGDLSSIEGVYVLDCAYGGYRLCRIVGTTGGERDITPRYGAAITADLIRAYTAGLYQGKKGN